jgi:hypothetical protein
MPTIALDSTPFEGRTSRPAAQIPRVNPGCTRCGSSLAKRLERVRRERDWPLWIWKCPCGRRRMLRQEATA